MTDHDTAIKQLTEKIAASFTGIGDPAKRALAVGAMLEAIPDLQRDLGHIRQAAVAELRAAGLSYAGVAEALGISRARAQQIAEGRTANARTRRAARAEADS